MVRPSLPGFLAIQLELAGDTTHDLTGPVMEIFPATSRRSADSLTQVALCRPCRGHLATVDVTCSWDRASSQSTFRFSRTFKSPKVCAFSSAPSFLMRSTSQITTVQVLAFRRQLLSV